MVRLNVVRCSEYEGKLREPKIFWYYSSLQIVCGERVLILIFDKVEILKRFVMLKRDNVGYVPM